MVDKKRKVVLLSHRLEMKETLLEDILTES